MDNRLKTKKLLKRLLHFLFVAVLSLIILLPIYFILVNFNQELAHHSAPPIHFVSFKIFSSRSYSGHLSAVMT